MSGRDPQLTPTTSTTKTLHLCRRYRKWWGQWGQSCSGRRLSGRTKRRRRNTRRKKKNMKRKRWEKEKQNYILKQKQKIKCPIKGYISRGNQTSLEDIREKSYWFSKNKNYYQRDLGMNLGSAIFSLHENKKVTKPFQAVRLTCKV